MKFIKLLKRGDLVTVKECGDGHTLYHKGVVKRLGGNHITCEVEGYGTISFYRNSGIRIQPVTFKPLLGFKKFILTEESN